MSRPDWCPQRVWDEALEYWRADGCSTGSANGYARAILASEQRGRERIIAQCEAVKASFLSPEYAANQPLGSLCERFAIDQCIEAIRGSSHD